MKAVVLNAYGPDAPFTVAELPRPTAAPGHVVIAVEATSVNPVDTKIRAGGRVGLAPALPAVLHGDVAGTVAEVGPGVTEFEVGDRVYGCAGGVLGSGGALAEFMHADADLIAHAPTRLPLPEAAALPLVAITAWEGLFDRALLQPGQRVLVYGATGGVGHVAVQLARWAGAVVDAVVSSPEKAAIANSLGATHVYNRTLEALPEAVEKHTRGAGYDIVFDTVGGPTLEEAFTLAAPYGHVIAIQSGGKEAYTLAPMHAKGLSLHFVFMLMPLLHHKGRAQHGGILREVARLVDTGDLRPLVDPARFTFADVARAHAHVTQGKAVGKVVVRKGF
jgi:NADPH2:quinone reductase